MFNITENEIATALQKIYDEVKENFIEEYLSVQLALLILSFFSSKERKFYFEMEHKTFPNNTKYSKVTEWFDPFVIITIKGIKAKYKKNLPKPIKMQLYRILRRLQIDDKSLKWLKNHHF